MRGLVVTEDGKGWRGPIERRLSLLWARPEFLAYDVRDLPSRFAAVQRARGLPVFTWTCRTRPIASAPPLMPISRFTKRLERLGNRHGK